MSTRRSSRSAAKSDPAVSLDKADIKTKKDEPSNLKKLRSQSKDQM